VTAQLLDDLRARKAAALARAISLVENAAVGFEDLLSALHEGLGRAHRIGLTGPPGAGKSTLVERLTQAYRARGLTVGVVAVDPSSPFTGGALLGDRIRMERAFLDPGVFIRSMASRGSLGGMATTTGEVADVMDAYGFDRILIETVGVGQSELDIATAADSTAVVLVPESGDGIQVMKAGLMEIADILVVNKADRPGADRIRQELEVAIGMRLGQAYRHVGAHHGAGHKGVAQGHGGTGARSKHEASFPSPHALMPPSRASWEPPVLATVASDSVGIDALVEAFERHYAHAKATGALDERRRRRLAVRTREVVDRAVRRWIWTGDGALEVEAALKDAGASARSPYEAAKAIIARLSGSVV
jgi:LAO/AO transport system kinase